MHLEHLKYIQQKIYTAKKFISRQKDGQKGNVLLVILAGAIPGMKNPKNRLLVTPYAKIVVEMWFILFIVIFLHSPIKKMTGYRSNDLFRAQNRCCILVKICPPGIAPFNEICRLSKNKEEITSFIILN